MLKNSPRTCVSAVHEEITYPCSQCDQKYKYKRHLRSHIASVHEKCQDFECKVSFNGTKACSIPGTNPDTGGIFQMIIFNQKCTFHRTSQT